MTKTQYEVLMAIASIFLTLYSNKNNYNDLKKDSNNKGKSQKKR